MDIYIYIYVCIYTQVTDAGLQIASFEGKQISTDFIAIISDDKLSSIANYQVWQLWNVLHVFICNRE